MSIPSRSAARRIALARLISLAGTEAAATALLFILFQRTGSATWVAAGLLLTLGTQGVLTPVLGSLGDRFDRRTVMIVSDLVGAVCFAVLAVVAAHGSPWALVALAFLASAAESPFFPASSAAIPNLVAPEDLVWANGTVALGANAGYLLGPAVGGALVDSIGAPAVFAVDAVSFVLSATLVATVRGPFTGRRDHDEGEEHRGVRAGFRFLFSDPVLRRLALAFSVFAVSVGSVLVAELPLATSFGAGSFGYGLIASMFGVGALAGSLAARRLNPGREGPAIVIASFVTAAGFAAVGVAPAFWAVLVAMLVAGSSDGLVDVAVETIVQRRSPDAVRSRVVGALEAVFLIGLSVSFAFAGALIDRFGPKFAYVLAGAGCAVAAALLVPLLHLPAEPQQLPAGEASRP